MNWLSNKAWAWTYTLEELRERASSQRHYWRQAFACIGLALLHLWGG